MGGLPCNGRTGLDYGSSYATCTFCLPSRNPAAWEKPTIYGRALLQCGVAVFDELRQGVKSLEFLADPGTGELRIGCSESLAAGFISVVVDRLSRQHPRAVFHVVPADPTALIDRELRQRNIELAI